jgi:hypothetical protein
MLKRYGSERGQGAGISTGNEPKRPQTDRAGSPSTVRQIARPVGDAKQSVSYARFPQGCPKSVQTRGRCALGAR